MNVKQMDKLIKDYHFSNDKFRETLEYLELKLDEVGLNIWERPHDNIVCKKEDHVKLLFQYKNEAPVTIEFNNTTNNIFAHNINCANARYEDKFRKIRLKKIGYVS